MSSLVQMLVALSLLQSSLVAFVHKRLSLPTPSCLLFLSLLAKLETAPNIFKLLFAQLKSLSALAAKNGPETFSKLKRQLAKFLLLFSAAKRLLQFCVLGEELDTTKLCQGENGHPSVDLLGIIHGKDMCVSWFLECSILITHSDSEKNIVWDMPREAKVAQTASDVTLQSNSSTASLVEAPEARNWAKRCTLLGSKRGSFLLKNGE